jgi:starch phosphorylase
VAAADLSGDDLWYAHQKAKQDLADYVFYQTGYQYDPQRLVVTWARRLAGYKRFDAVFADVERLRAILAHTDRPVQLLLAGKAHFGDTQAKATLKQIIDYFKQQLAGYALFIPNYNIDVAKMLVKGSDVWLNTPEYGKEASGTSGMKAMSNGVINCSVPDGWVPEVDWLGRGWTLDSDHIAESLYTTLGAQIAPLYYRRDEHGVPQEWLSMMKANVLSAHQFSSARMLQEYHQYLYTS